MERIPSRDREHVSGANVVSRAVVEVDARDAQAGRAQLVLDLIGDPRIGERIRRRRNQDRAIAARVKELTQTGNAARGEQEPHQVVSR
jgi:hypothetical protein